MANGFQAATPDGAAHTGTDTWITPKWVIDLIGLSDLDPCGWTPNGEPFTETAHRYFTEEVDGLSQPWEGSVFVNFPYSQAYEWMKRCSEHNNGIVLCFARTETKAWQENVKNATGMVFINKRIKFLTGEGVEKSNGNAPSVLIAWGEDNYQRIKRVPGFAVRMDS